MSVLELSRTNGLPVTVTASVKVAVTGITSPTLYVPLLEVDVTAVIAGSIPSMTNALFAPREPKDPGSGSARAALLVPESVIVPSFNVRALVLA